MLGEGIGDEAGELDEEGGGGGGREIENGWGFGMAHAEKCGMDVMGYRSSVLHEVFQCAGLLAEGEAGRENNHGPSSRSRKKQRLLFAVYFCIWLAI